MLYSVKTWNCRKIRAVPERKTKHDVTPGGTETCFVKESYVFLPPSKLQNVKLSQNLPFIYNIKSRKTVSGNTIFHEITHPKASKRETVEKSIWPERENKTTIIHHRVSNTRGFLVFQELMVIHKQRFYWKSPTGMLSTHAR